MNRLELVRTEMDKFLLFDDNAENRKDGYIHLYGVAQYCTLLALKRGLDIEICAITGMLHDIYTYKVRYTKRHGILGAAIAQNLLKKLLVFTDEEIEIIVVAIANHSHKKTIHDPYSELLKDADTLQNSLYNPKISIKHRKRLKLILKELGIKVKLNEIVGLSNSSFTESAESQE